MVTVLVTVIALVAVAVAAYLLGEVRVIRTVNRSQAQDIASMNVANSALLDRLVVKHGFMPLAEKPSSPNLPIQSMELADPFSIAQTLWADEDDARLRVTMSAAERAEIEEAARQRGNKRNY